MTDLNNLPPLTEWQTAPPGRPELIAENLIERLVLIGVCVFGFGLFVGVLLAGFLLRYAGT